MNVIKFPTMQRHLAVIHHRAMMAKDKHRTWSHICPAVPGGGGPIITECGHNCELCGAHEPTGPEAA